MLVLAVLAVFLLLLCLAGYGVYAFIRHRQRKNASENTENAENEGLPPEAEAAAEANSEADAVRPSPPALSSRIAEKATFKVFGSIPLHCLIVVLLTLGLLVPLEFVTDLVRERSSMHRSAIRDISAHWGETQHLRGPVLVVPYVRKYVSYVEHNKKIIANETFEREYRVLLPASVDFTADITPQTRARGIYEYIVYTSPITVTGTFQIPKNAAEFGENVQRIEWNKAWFAAGVADLKAIASIETLVWNGKSSAPFQPGTEIASILGSGFHTQIPLDPAKDAGEKRSFSLSAVVKGSGGIYFTPVGENTRIKLTAAWAHPKFSGAILPKEYTIDDKAGQFSAVWDIPHLSRTYPQAANVSMQTIDEVAEARSPREGVVYTETPNARPRVHVLRNELSELTDFTVGVELFEPVSLYTQAARAVKYAILFIGLTFIALLSFELGTRKRLHFLQYCLVGVAMVLFYLVLLSLAEHTAFFNAFLAASAVSVVMNSLYMTAAFRSPAQGGILAVLLAALYAILYAILQIEEYALLVGTALVVAVVAVLMFLTRNLSNGVKTT
ncbi:MAG: cell envelope integrity protein CreD [Candidatus Accumulibacter sp.]|nr:cell envelope integrity protein CreD [Accumulibacter sp.]